MEFLSKFEQLSYDDKKLVLATILTPITTIFPVVTVQHMFM